MASIHAAAARGFANASATYARGRPDYPAALDGWLRDALGLGPGRIVLDLGAGTGKFTTRLSTTGAAVIAVDPVPEMLDELLRACPGIDARAGRADALPVDDGALDAVVCAQAFHWFATVEALAEIHRVLRPGGALALVWNVRDERVAWVRRLTDLLTPYEGDAPRFRSGRWRDVFPAEGFGALDEIRFEHVHTGPAERVIVDRSLSVSFIAALPDDEQARVRQALHALVDGEATLAGRAEVVFPYETLAYRCVKCS